VDAYLAFHQSYQPVLDNILLSALVAGLPLYVLFILLAVLRLPAWICALAAMLTAFVLGWLVWGMDFGISVGAATEGMAFGLWPISWIVLNAVFFHNLTVASGDFDVIRRSLTRLTEDRRRPQHRAADDGGLEKRSPGEMSHGLSAWRIQWAPRSGIESSRCSEPPSSLSRRGFQRTSASRSSSLSSAARSASIGSRRKRSRNAASFFSR